MIRMRPVVLCFLGLIFIISSCTCVPTQPVSQTLTVHFIDVGQGDSILIDIGETEVLIDGGERSPGVVEYLAKYIDGPIDVMVATHTDADHIGGLIAVLAQYNVAEIWVNGYVATSKTYTDFVTLVNAEGAAVHEAELGDTIRAGTLEFHVLNPPANLFSDANNNSIVLTLSFAGTDFLFTGDAETEAEEAMLMQSSISLPDIEVLKVGHHASRTASSADFLNIIKPDIAIYMCAAENRYEHPHQETINALNAIGTDIYGTEEFGTVTVTIDDSGFHINTEKTP